MICGARCLFKVGIFAPAPRDFDIFYLDGANLNLVNLVDKHCSFLINPLTFHTILQKIVADSCEI